MDAIRRTQPAVIMVAFESSPGKSEGPGVSAFRVEQTRTIGFPGSGSSESPGRRLAEHDRSLLPCSLEGAGTDSQGMGKGADFVTFAFVLLRVFKDLSPTSRILPVCSRLLIPVRLNRVLGASPKSHSGWIMFAKFPASRGTPTCRAQRVDKSQYMTIVINDHGQKKLTPGTKTRRAAGADR